MKTLLFASALALGTAAAAEPQSLTINGPAQKPLAATAVVESIALADFKPVARNGYPLCSVSVRDNCVQAHDPGGSQVALAQAEGTMFADNIQTAQAKPTADAYTGLGGPEFEVDDSEYTAGKTFAEPADGYQPITRDAYPPCSATITDNCQQ